MTSVRQGFEETLLTIVRSQELLLVAILSVIFYAFYYPAPYETQLVEEMPLVVVDQDNSPISRALVEKLGDTSSVNVVANVANVGEAREMLMLGQAEGILLLGPDLGLETFAARPGTGVVLWLNGTYLIRAEGVEISIVDILEDAFAEVADRLSPNANRSIDKQILVQPMFNIIGGYRDYVFPAVANIILQQTLLLASARLIADRRRRGWSVLTLPRALGMLLACATICALSTYFYFGWVFWIQDVPRAGNMPGILLSVPFFAIAVAGAGLWIGSYLRNGDDTEKIIASLSLPLVFLGGFAWPLDQMPGWVQTVAWLSPSTAAMHVFIRFNQMGASLYEALTPLIIMIALAIVYSGAFLVRVGFLDAAAANGPADRRARDPSFSAGKEPGAVGD